MKRFAAFLLMLFLVFTMCSCGKKHVQEEPVPPVVKEHVGGEQQPVEPAPDTTEPVVVPEEPIAPIDQAVKPDKQAEPQEESYYHGGGSTVKNLTITEGKTVTGGTYQNVTIAESVGNGTVTLQNVTIKGKLIVRGGGSNSIKMDGCNVSTVVMDKDISGGGETPRLELTGTEVKSVEVTKPAIIEATDSNSAVKTLSAKDDVTIKGADTKVETVSVPTDAGNDVKLTVNDASVAKVEVNKPVTIETNAAIGKTPVQAVEAKANVTVAGAATNVGTITVPEEAANPVTLTVTDAKVKEVSAAKPVTITANENASKIEKVDAAAAVTVKGDTKIDKVEAKAPVTVNGDDTKINTITVPTGVTTKPEIKVNAGSVNTVEAKSEATVSGGSNAVQNVEAAAPVEVASAAVAKVTVTVNVTVTVTGSSNVEVAVEVETSGTETVAIVADTNVSVNVSTTKAEAPTVKINNTEVAHIHKWVESEKTEATCTGTGLIKYTCTASGCTESAKQETIPAKGHTEVVLPAVEPTCTAAGSTAGKKCAVCDAIIVATREIKALGHDFTGSYVSDETGHWHVCAYCGMTDAKSTHKYSTTDCTVAAKCTECGYQKATGVHTWDAGEVKTAPTCETAGSVLYTCTSCSATKTETVAAPGHTYGAPSYQWSGTSCTAMRSCTRSGCSHTESETAAGSPYVLKDASCTQQGATAYTATFKNGAFTAQTTQIKTDMKAHSLTKVAAKAATCTAAGNNEYWVCKDCGKAFSDAQGNTPTTPAAQAINALGHKLTKTEAKAAACTEAGNSAYWTCDTCSKVFSDENGTTETTVAAQTIPTLGHKGEKQNGQAATCEAAGWKDYYKCSQCQKLFSDAACKSEITDLAAWETGGGKVAVLGHSYGDPSYVWDGTSCTATRVCANDSAHKLTETKTGTYVQDTAATCTANEKGHYTVAFNDTQLGSASTAANSSEKANTATGHSYADIWSHDATYHWYAATCEHTQEVSGKAEHSFGAWSNGQRTCSVCNYVETCSHTWNDGVVTTEPTCTATGVKTFTCTVCGAAKTETIAALGHKMTQTAAKAATCTEAGNSAYWTCDTCSKVFSDENGTTETTVAAQTIKALGHKLSKTDAKAATCTEDGTKEYWTCSVCDKVFADEACKIETTVAARALKALGHTFDQEVDDSKYLKSAATCTAKAVYYKSCTCGATGTETFEFGSALGHSFTNYVSDNNATCIADGTKTAKCDRCDATDTVANTGSKLGHSFTTKASTAKVSDATCTAKAVYKVQCDRCNAVSDTVTVEVGEVAPNNHTGALGEWQTNGSKHWKEYSCCHAKTDEAAHTGGTATCKNKAVCAVCSAEYGELDQSNHSYGEVSYVWNGTQCTATRVCTNDTSHKETETAEGAYTLIKEATYTEDGSYVYKATFSNPAFAEQTSASTPIPATPFVVNEQAYTTYEAALAAAHEAGLKEEKLFDLTYKVYPTIEIYGNCTLDSLNLAVGESIAVMKDGSLTVSGALTLETSTIEYWMFDAGVITVENGGSFKWGDVQYTGANGVFAMDDAKSYIALTGCPKDVKESGIFFLLNGDVTLNAGKSFATDDISNMIVQQKLTVAGTLTNKNQLENRGTIDVVSGGSLLNYNTIENDSDITGTAGTVNVYGTLTNASGAVINGGTIDAFGGTLENSGTIRGEYGKNDIGLDDWLSAIYLEKGATLTNTGTITNLIDVADYYMAGEKKLIPAAFINEHGNLGDGSVVERVAAVFDRDQLKTALETKSDEGGALYDLAIISGTEENSTVDLSGVTVPEGVHLALKESVFDGTNTYHNKFTVDSGTLTVSEGGGMSTLGGPDVTVGADGNVLTYDFTAFENLTISGHVDCEGDRMMVTKKLTINESGKLEIGGEGEFIYVGEPENAAINGTLMSTTRYLNGITDQHLWKKSTIEGVAPNAAWTSLVIIADTVLYGEKTVDAIVLADNGLQVQLVAGSTLQYKLLLDAEGNEIAQEGMPGWAKAATGPVDGYYTLTGDFAGTVVNNDAELTAALEKGGDIYLLPFVQGERTYVLMEYPDGSIEDTYETQYHIDTTAISNNTNLISLGGEEPIAVFFDEGFTVNENVTLSFNGLNVVAVKNSFVDGTIEAHNGIMVVQGEEGTTLTVNAGGTIVVGAENEWGALAIFTDQNNKIVNNGTIMRFGDLIFDLDREKGQFEGNEPLEYANYADVVRDLYDQFREYPNMEGLFDEDYDLVNAYPDSNEMYNEEQPEDSDFGALDAFAWLIKNDILPECGEETPELRPYHYVTRDEVGELFSKFAAKVLATEANVNITGNGYLCRTDNILVEGEDRYTSERNQCFDALREALKSLSSVNAATEGDFLNALDTPYVTEIHVTDSFTLNGCYYKDGQRVGETDEHNDENACYLWGAGEYRDQWREIIVEPGVTLTVAKDVKVDIRSGVELRLADGENDSNGKLDLFGGLNVFGGLQPDNWWEETGEDENRQRKYVIEEEGSYINFYPDVMDFAKRLRDCIEDRSVDAATADDIAGYQEVANEWPTDDDRAEYFAFAVKYGLEPHHEGDEENPYIVWRPYDKVQYGEAMAVLGNVYKELCKDAAEIPFGLGEEWQDDCCISDHDVDLLLDAFVNALPQQEDDTTAFTVMRDDGNHRIITGKKFTQPITITCGTAPTDGDNFGGDIEFRNCEFAGGVTVQLAAGINYNIRLNDSCTGAFTVTAKDDTIKGAPGTGVNFFGTTGVTVNGLTISGTAGWQDWDYNINTRFDGYGEDKYIFTVEVTNNRDNTVYVSGNYSGKLRVAGKLDISGVTMADNSGWIELANWNDGNNGAPESNIKLGANDISINDDWGSHSFTGTGTIHVNGDPKEELQLNVNERNLGTPHVFGSDGNYSIYLGLTDLTDVGFEVKQGDTTLSGTPSLYNEEGPVGEGNTSPATKCHIEKTDDNWFHDPNDVRLEVTVKGCKVVYENLCYKGE